MAIAYFHPGHSLIGRIISFEEAPIETILRQKFEAAATLRKEFIDSAKTTGYRLINAEGDGLPGLVVDRYGDYLVIQITTQGMERLRQIIVQELISFFAPQGIYEKSRGSARLQEGLEEKEGPVWGDPPDEIAILENGLRFVVSLRDGQKTGFFCDQREMRNWVFSHAKNKRVLNCFSYTGGFSIAALAGGAERVDSIDLCSSSALLASRNAELNGFDPSRHTFFQEDVFTFLSTRPLVQYDLIILDPPAFAKKRNDVDRACTGYKQIVRQAMSGAKPGALLLISSCSYYIDESLFQTLAGQAACEAGRTARIIGSHIQAPDHPISLAHPEGRYLKSLLLMMNDD